jgi:hypothetical protein
MLMEMQIIMRMIMWGMKMIDKLKYLIDHYENNPKMKAIFLEIAKMSEKDQDLSLQAIEIVLGLRK